MLSQERFEAADAILLCGGEGLRLKELTGEITKPLYEIAGRPLIQYSLDHLVSPYVRRLIFAVDYQVEQIRAWVIGKEFPRQEIYFFAQTQPGILEAVRQTSVLVREDNFIVCNTDEIQDGLHMEAFLDFHRRNTTLATMLAVYTDHLYRHRVLDIRQADQCVVNTDLENSKYRGNPEEKALVNGGLVIINKAAIEYFDPTHGRGWSGIIDPLCQAGQLSAFVAPEVVYFNVGTPEIYFEARAYLQQTRQG